MSIQLPIGFEQIAFDHDTLCTLDGVVEHPSLVVRLFGHDDEVWQACTRYDSLSRQPGDPRYTPDYPYWHPTIIALGDNEPAAVCAERVHSGACQ